MITGEITGIAFGGEGILRHEGMVIFVPFAMQGDHVSCRIIEQKKNYARAELIRIEKASPLRILPRCIHYNECGGCKFQHLPYQAQMEHKHTVVDDALSRIGGLSLNQESQLAIVPATDNWAYRRHITLNLKFNQDRLRAGYLSSDGTTLLPITQCLIFADENDQAFGKLDRLLQKLTVSQENEGRVTLFKANHQKEMILHFQFDKMPPNSHDLFKDSVNASEWAGILLSSPVGEFSWGQTSTNYEIDQINFTLSPKAFSQNNPEQSSKIYQQITNLASQNKPKKILDLYCGVGIISLMLAKRLASEGSYVIGVEGNPVAIELAKQNAKQNQINNVTFYEADVGQKINSLIKRDRFDCIIVNPPRTGLQPEVVKALLRAAPQQIVYLSCMPSTLARDLKNLSQIYQIDYCQPYDMFPQTAHVETLINLTLKKAG